MQKGIYVKNVEIVNLFNSERTISSLFLECLSMTLCSVLDLSIY